jgi:hypothetical protein
LRSRPALLDEPDQARRDDHDDDDREVDPVAYQRLQHRGTNQDVDQHVGVLAQQAPQGGRLRRYGELVPARLRETFLGVTRRQTIGRAVDVPHDLVCRERPRGAQHVGLRVVFWRELTHAASTSAARRT